jgi:hypothetical protein
MSVFTNVPNTVLEPGDPIRSVDIIAIKENTNFLNEKHTTNVQTFNASGTWTKPTLNGTGVGNMARIQVWGGGGGAGRGNITLYQNGGGGGGYNEIIVPISSLGATVTVTVGAAGAGRTGSTGNGTTGGTSSFGTVISAFGGAGGGGNTTNISGAGGGGPLSAGGIGSINDNTVGVPGNPILHVGLTGVNTAVRRNASSMGAGGLLVTTDGIFSFQGNAGIYHGGGGGASGSFSGGSLWGGGAGSNGSIEGAGTSLYGGNGGARNNAGVQPGGGGGASSSANGNGSNGGAGRVVITVF